MRDGSEGEGRHVAAFPNECGQVRHKLVQLPGALFVDRKQAPGL